MNDALLVIIFILVIFEADKDRAHSGFVFAFFCGFHTALAGSFSGFYYYFSAGLFDLVVIYVLCTKVRPSRLNNMLIDISLLSILLNSYGWMLYRFNYLADTYNMCYTGLYVLAILSILRRERANDYQIRKWHNGIRTAVYKCSDVCRSVSKEARR